VTTTLSPSAVVPRTTAQGTAVVSTSPPGPSGRVPTRVRTNPFSRLRVAPMTVFWLLIVAILVVPILLFLLVAFSPALLDQGTEWFTLSAFSEALSGQFLVALLNSLLVGVVTAVGSAVIGFGMAWIVRRTNSATRRLWTGAVFALLLAPSYLIALGWQRLLEPGGVLEIVGFHPTLARTFFYGPAGIVLVLTVKGIPFAYLVIANAMRSLGGEFEQAVRVHGGNRMASLRVMIALLSPAVWSALAIVFAEAISDFGVASTLSSAAHFPVATFMLYNAIQAFPVQFPLAAAVSWVLLGLIVLALLAQSWALRGRSFRVLGGRSRPTMRIHLTRSGQLATGAITLVLLVVTLGVPAFGALSASVLTGLGSAMSVHSWSLDNYARVLTSPDLRDPLLYSAQMAAITATVATLMAAVCARMLASSKKGVSARLLDFVLLAAVALPGIVFAAGYIFAYNLPLMNTLGIHIYGTSALLTLAYVATALPSTSRSLVGNMSQLHESMSEACRVHGSGKLRTWFAVVMPVIARPLLAAWLLTYAATLLELPVSQLLYPPGSAPISVGINKALSAYDFGGGTAMEVLAILSALAVVGIAYLLFAILAPQGWKRLGRTS
jgi:iron(III) transport system permease protein